VLPAVLRLATCLRHPAVNCRASSGLVSGSQLLHQNNAFF
jgi:hypothetical protein